MRYSPNHPTMRGREIPETLAERRAAVKQRLGIPQREPRYKLKCWLGFIGLVAAAGIVEHSPLLAVSLTPVIAWLWLSGTNNYDRRD